MNGRLRIHFIVHLFISQVFSCLCYISIGGNDYFQKKKVIVDYDILLETLGFCHSCASVCAVNGRVAGATVTVKIQCLNGDCKLSRYNYRLQLI